MTQKAKSYFLMSVASLYTPCFVMFCVFLYGPFCHGAHNLTCPHCLQHFVFEHLFHLYLIYDSNYFSPKAICASKSFFNRKLEVTWMSSPLLKLLSLFLCYIWQLGLKEMMDLQKTF